MGLRNFVQGVGLATAPTLERQNEQIKNKNRLADEFDYQQKIANANLDRLHKEEKRVLAEKLKYLNAVHTGKFANDPNKVAELETALGYWQNPLERQKTQAAISTEEAQGRYYDALTIAKGKEKPADDKAVEWAKLSETMNENKRNLWTAGVNEKLKELQEVGQRYTVNAKGEQQDNPKFSISKARTLASEIDALNKLRGIPSNYSGTIGRGNLGVTLESPAQMPSAAVVPANANKLTPQVKAGFDFKGIDPAKMNDFLSRPEASQIVIDYMAKNGVGKEQALMDIISNWDIVKAKLGLEDVAPGGVPGDELGIM
jgi:hypothetical protein